jgi:ABC-type nitrate/sulfonate/bicarbonate transport system permease component
MSEGTADPTVGEGSLDSVALDGVPLDPGTDTRAPDTMAALAVGRAPGGTGGRSPGRYLRLVRPVFNAVVTLVVLIGLWWAFVAAFNLDPLIAKTPADVFTYLWHGPAPDSGAQPVWGGLGRTLLDALYGFVAGLIAAVAVALSFVLSRLIAGMLLPLAVLVRSVPLVAMTPVLTLVFGRGIVATTVIAGIVVFFPALVTMTFGLRSASRQSAGLVRAYGGGTWTVARKVMLPSSLPALFASARIAVPGAVIGAMLAEWLATGVGLGYGMLQDANSFNYVDIWASAALLTGVSVVLYNIVAVAESAVLGRFSLRDAR